MCGRSGNVIAMDTAGFLAPAGQLTNRSGRISRKNARNLPFMGCLPAMRSVMQMASLPVNATAADEPRNRAAKWRTPGDALSFGPGRADTVGSRDTPARGRAWTSPRILHLIVMKSPLPELTPHQEVRLTEYLSSFHAAARECGLTSSSRRGPATRI